MHNILIGLVVLIIAGGLLAMIFRPVGGPRHFVDADEDGEPDESPEEKRRALETDAD